MGTRVNFSTAFHPQTDGQVERVNQILEDMLRACVISFGKNWEKSLPFAEFSYNNSYQSSLGRAPFEVLYGRKCRTPLNWSETGERQFFGPDMIQEAEEQVSVIREHLKSAQSRQKSYYDKRHREMSFEIGEKAYLKVSPLRGVRRFGIKGKLAPRYVGPFTSSSEAWRACLISWSYQPTFRMFMMCFMCPNFVVASKIPFVESNMRVLIFSPTCLIASILFVFLMKRKGKLEAKLSSFSKFNGPTIPKMKQPGNEKIVYDLSTLPSSLVFRISGRDSCKGGRLVTSHFCNKVN